MEKSKRHIRHCLLFNYKLRKSAAGATRLLCDFVAFFEFGKPPFASPLSHGILWIQFAYNPAGFFDDFALVKHKERTCSNSGL